MLTDDVLDIALEPMQEDDFDLRDLRIDGVGPPERKQPGQCTHGQAGECYFVPYRYQSMYVYPDTTKWPESVFTAKNSGRKARLEVDPAIYGPLTSGRIRIGNTAWADFAGTQAAPTCLLDATPEVAAGKVEYIATLPDLTRLPAGEVAGVVELRFGSAAPRVFDIVLSTGVPKVDVVNPNVDTLTINALTDVILGNYDTPDLAIPVDSPGHGVGSMDNVTENTGKFDLRRGAEGAAINVMESTSSNDVAGNSGGSERVQGLFFGFTDGTHLFPETITLFDTGLIPLFRYSFGVAPIAAATIGADLWMAATLKYYGELRPEGMNATIDPRVAGGVNLFFDLDLLFGLVSGSISAESELGLAMRAKINQGGLAHLTPNASPPAGKCFTFDLDGVWEACAAGICGGGRESLITVREPSGCAASKQSLFDFDGQGMLLDKGGVATRTDFDLGRPRYTASALGGDGRGHAVSIGVNAAGDILATHIVGGVATAPRTIATGAVAVQHLDVAYFATDRAVAVWSENSRTLAAVTDLVRTQRGRAFDDIARTQVLRYSTWNGASWTIPQALTTGGSDGKPQLAGCLPPPRSTILSCPASGEITAVWERDANANLDAPDLEIWSARYHADGRGWSTPVRVSSTGISSDMLPSVAYRNSTPVVAWARNPGGAFTDLTRRQVAYRFLDGSSTQQIATELGTSVGWVDVGVSNADDVVVAYTRAQDPLGFVGNRQALYSARATSCPSGVCDFLVTEVRDPSSRQFRVERPRVAFDEDDTPVIGFRALAYGPDARGRQSQPGDLPGIMLGTGELGMVRVHSFARTTYRASFVGLSDDALQHWKPDFIYDETLGGVLAVSMPAVAPPGFSEPLAVAKMMSPLGSPVASKGLPLDDGSELRSAMAGPDFVLRDASLSRTVVASGQALQLDATLDNIGAHFTLADHGSVKVVASLDGPAGAGAPLGTFEVAGDQSSNASRVVSLALVLPAGVRADERHTVFIDIEAGELANTIDSTADHARIEVNAMPVPAALNAITREGSPSVSLTWANPLDPRVYGWRVWKMAADGSWQHLGSTRQLGYMDVTAIPGQDSTYRVASYSANGMESEPSNAVSAQVVVPKGVGIFADDFETRVP